tara:strand:- start:184 stop:444 length:261 start_codon:yes stop_codon:yes gene_type:complete
MKSIKKNLLKPLKLTQNQDVMKDQNAIHEEESQNQKWNRGLDLYIESVQKPDHQLRACAHNQKCYNELMAVREHVLEYVKTLRKEV